MALSDLERFFIYNTSNQIWQQDLLLNAYFQGSTVGANLREMMIGNPPVQPLTNPYDEAITGKLRSDSSAIRQNARNVQEAAQMMGIAEEALGTIKTSLEEMEDLALKVADGDLDYTSTLAEEYDALRDKIKSTVENTRYNGIALLDSEQWGTSQIDAQGNVYIQAYLDGGFDVTFRPLDQVNWDALQGSDLEDDPAGSLQTQLETLSTYINDTTVVEDIYSGRKSGLEFQSASLESQADILDQAVDARRQSPELSLEEILLNLLYRYSGTIIDQTG